MFRGGRGGQKIEQNLEWLYADDPNVFVAGDLFWYPVEEKPNIVNAPDVIMVFGRPKRKRGSYQQWNEQGIAPQLVFEILSPSNSQEEMDRKLLFYDRYGVLEYYIYNPERNQSPGWLRGEEGLEPIALIANWVSPILGIRFDLSEEELQIYRPNGTRFFSYVEICQMLEEQRQRAEQAEAALEHEPRRSQLFAERLREMGVNPDELTRFLTPPAPPKLGGVLRRRFVRTRYLASKKSCVAIALRAPIATSF